MIRDPDPGVRRATVDALWMIWRRIVSLGIRNPPNHVCRMAFAEALISLDPVIATKVALETTPPLTVE